METNEIITKKSLLQKLILFFARPVELFRDYEEKPAWALKLFLISLITALFAYATKILGKDLLVQMLEEQAASLPAEQAEAVRASMGFMNSPIMSAVSVAAAVVTTIALILLVSLAYMVLIRAFKGSIKYKQSVSIYTLAYMATAIGLLAKLAYMYFSGNLLYFNLKPTYMDSVYDCLDPFTVWQSILMVFGISAISGLSEKKSTIIVIIMWLVSLLVSLGSVMLAK